MNRLGFSLMELMVVVLILGILAAIGLPGFGKTRERAYWQEAEQTLLAIYAGERAYFLINDAYYDVNEGAGDPMAEWRRVNIDNPNLGSIPVTYTVSASGSTFSATATRTSGPCGNKTRTINESRVLTAGTCWASCGC